MHTSNGILLRLKRTELLIHTTWSNLKILLLSKRSQTKKRTFCMIPFTQKSKKYKVIYRDRKQTSGSLETEWRGVRNFKGA